MFSKLIAFLILMGGVYILMIFTLPEFIDQYGNKELNNKIRSIKDQSLEYASGTESPSSIAEKVLNTSQTIIGETQSMIHETQQTVENTQKIITEKTEQIKKTTDSVEKAYNAIEEAKMNINNLTSLSGATKQ